MASDWTKIDAIDDERRLLKQSLKDLKESREDYAELMGDADDKIEIWEVRVSISTLYSIVPTNLVRIAHL